MNGVTDQFGFPMFGVVLSLAGFGCLWWVSRYFVPRKEHDEQHMENEERFQRIEKKLDGMPSPEDWRSVRDSTFATREAVEWIKRWIERMGMPGGGQKGGD